MRILVNDDVIEEHQISAEMDRLRNSHDQAFLNMSEEEKELQLRKWSKENLIERVLLAQEARKRNYPQDEGAMASRFAEIVGEEMLDAEEEQRLWADIRLEFQVTQLLNELKEQASVPDDATIKKFYSDNPEMFVVPEQVNAAHIVMYINKQQNKIEAYKRICEVQERLKAGESFETLAKNVSDCKEWQLGWFAEGQMVKPFEDAVFSLQPGQISDIILTEYGYHIARVYEYKPQHILPFEEVKNQIRDYLWNESIEEQIFKLIDTLKEKAEIHEEE
ncbi:MAG: hypothetical protein GXO77_14075 [Calditrichaeota bacterium]|nr:hypothetical protein [Calditrichota bacterium]